MVAAIARGRGLATALCEHSQKMALAMGYQAMQFNFVVATNQNAIRLWTKLGFETVGRLPKAFQHPKAGYVDALVMYKWLLPDTRRGDSSLGFGSEAKGGEQGVTNWI
jgi:ribosomal protein S18 acetylase RimI-like enzyme